MTYAEWRSEWKPIRRPPTVWSQPIWWCLALAAFSWAIGKRAEQSSFGQAVADVGPIIAIFFAILVLVDVAERLLWEVQFVTHLVRDLLKDADSDDGFYSLRTLFKLRSAMRIHDD